jgi:hypothetical protein
MKRTSKIESVNIRRHHLGLTGIIYSEGYVYAVRFAPNTAVTESLIRRLWQRHDGRNHLSVVARRTRKAAAKLLKSVTHTRLGKSDWTQDAILLVKQGRRHQMGR